jgi:hypothetical protein
MPLYKVKYIEEVVMVGYIYAENEDEAQELLDNGEVEDARDVDSINLRLEEIEEVERIDY